MDPKRGPKWHPKSLKNGPRRPRPAQERPRAAGRPKKTPPGGPNSRPSEAHKHTKKLFENTDRKVFRNSFTQDPPTILGSVAGIGGAAPLEIRPLSRSGSTRGRERSEWRGKERQAFENPQRLPKVNSPKSPPPGPHPPAAGGSSPLKVPRKIRRVKPKSAREYRELRRLTKLRALFFR